MIPSSLSYSSSCSSSSASASSTHIGSISVPIQVTKTPKNNNNINPTRSTITESQKGYRYVQRPSPQAKLLSSAKVGNKVQPAVPRPVSETKKFFKHSTRVLFLSRSFQLGQILPIGEGVLAKVVHGHRKTVIPPRHQQKCVLAGKQRENARWWWIMMILRYSARSSSSCFSLSLLFDSFCYHTLLDAHVFDH